MTALIIIAGLALALPLVDTIRRPILRRQAVRNLVRRPGESAIVVVGALLGTAIITASFIVGDTIAGSIRDIARTELGPIDEAVVVDDVADLASVVATVEAQPPDGIDGMLTSTRTRVAVAHQPDEISSRLAAGSVAAFGYDFAQAREFGGNASATGLADAGPTPLAGQAAVSEELARTLRLEVGDTADVFVYGGQHALTVTAILPNVGLAGRGGEAILVGPGTIETWWADRTGAEARGPLGELLISNDGGVFDGADGTGPVLDHLQRTVGHLPGVEVADWKADLLEDADEEGNELTTVFSSIGAFAVIAGILLVVNIVVMLTDERRTQLGVLRALGLRRNHIVRVMGLEGTAYALVASAVGALAGVGVGWVVAQFARTIVAEDGLDLRFAMEPSSLFLGGLIGLLVTLGTVWATSLRLARMNVITAIRELPSPAHHRRALRAALGGSIVVAAGAALGFVGITGESPIPALLGPALVSLGLIPLVRPALGSRLSASLGGLGAIVWGIAVFVLLPDAMRDPEIAVFVFQGVVLVTGAVLVLTVNSGAWKRLLSITGGGVPMRLGLTYPLARPGRTGLILGMYSLVIFTIMFMASFSAVFERQSDDIAAEASAGFDILIDSNATNPATTETLVALPEIDDASPIMRVWGDVLHNGNIDGVPVTGIDDRFLAHGGPPLSAWSEDYADGDAVFAAIVAGEPVAVIGEFLFDDDSGGPENPGLGDTLRIVDPAVEGTATDVTVVGVLSNDWMWNGVVTGRGVVTGVFDDAVDSRHYATVSEGIRPEVAAAAVNGSLVANGADARSFEKDVLADINSQNGFIRILQGYLALGLLIGVAGLAIVLVRAVRERRREIGMLRAMGYRSATIRQSFLVEALFIAGQGSVLGVLLGSVTAWQVVTNADVFAVGDPDFVLPVGMTALILIGPIVASLLAAVWPASRASKIRPAVALRVNG